MAQPSFFRVYNASAGSGKTFTLVKEYLKLLLGSGNPRAFQNILAITFTNKAAAEMKDRVLDYLLDFSLLDDQSEDIAMMDLLQSETMISRELLSRRAQESLRQILKDYSSFHINTIDSFTNRLIKSFAFDLNLSLDFEVELDTESILNETVDLVLSDIGIVKDLTELLVHFARQKTLQDRSWDISRELLDMAKLLLNENHIREFDRISNKDLSDFRELEIRLNQLHGKQKKKLKDLGTTGLSIIEDHGLTQRDFYAGQFPKFFKKMIDDPEKLVFDPDRGLQKSIETQTFYAKSKPQEIKDSIEEIIDSLIDIYWRSKVVFESMMRSDLLKKNLTPMAVSHTISRKLEELKENNNIRLNAEFNKLISDHLMNEPAPFIYEKLGERFRHFFIDEMQDTSIMQWENLIPLIHNALSTENTGLLLVGDAKQAIYRWRGGKAEQFISLSSDLKTPDSNPFQIRKNSINLDTNYRSFSEIINFNNEFFSHIAKHFKNVSYQNLYLSGCQQKVNSRTGGYVKFDLFEPLQTAELRDEIYPERVYLTLNELLEQYDPHEICILVRKKKEGVAIAKYLNDKGIEIVSSETLMIKNNRKVDFIIQLLSYLKESQNSDAKFEMLDFLYDHLNIESDKHEFLQEMVHKKPHLLFRSLQQYGVDYQPESLNDYAFMEGVEEIVRTFRLNEKPDAFIQFFMDVVYDFNLRKSQKKVDFLEFWNERSDQFNIVSTPSKKAVRIMTIHKSKGLEFPVVIFPYDMNLYRELNPKAWFNDLDKEEFSGFDSLLVDSTSNIQNTGPSGREIFHHQRIENQLDSFNLLYVCFTRAIEQLYIISELKKEKEEPVWSSHLLRDFLMGTDQWVEGISKYEFGSVKRVSERVDATNETEIQKSYKSQSRRSKGIHILPNSKLIWDPKITSAISYGNLIHEIMSEIVEHDDLEHVLSKYIQSGVLLDEQGKKVREAITEIVNHPVVKPYFENGLKVFNERELLTIEGQVLKPDRIVFKENRLTIIDYKTGKPENKHRVQIENYAVALQGLNYKIGKKILIYMDQNLKRINVEII